MLKLTTRKSEEDNIMHLVGGEVVTKIRIMNKELQ